MLNAECSTVPHSAFSIQHSAFLLAIDLLRNPVLLQLLVKVAARRADDFGGLRDVPVVLAQLANEERPLGGLLELAQRAGPFLLRLGCRTLLIEPDDVA